MAKRNARDLIVGLDIGTSKVVAMVGELHADGRIEVIGIGSHPSRGLKKGVVVNIESTVQSIQRAVEEAELMAGVRDPLGLRRHRRQPRAQPELARHRRDQGQGGHERRRRARDRRRPRRRHPGRPEDPAHLPQEFIIDGQEGIREPIGMSGVRLEARCTS
jgi:cell division protein FtsA